MEINDVLAQARAARDAGAARFCMGAAWRNPKDRDLDAVCAMVEGVRAMGLETCVTLGMLTQPQASRLARSGLDYYNHNLDTSPEHYGAIITTRTYQDRLETLAHVRDAGIHVCCGGIVGMGETLDDRAGLLVELANLPRHPESVPINMLVRVAGTPLADAGAVDPIDFVRVIAAARIMMPRARVRLAAGREGMSDETQALCLLAGANSIFYGAKLLTTPNPAADRDNDPARKARLHDTGRHPLTRPAGPAPDPSCCWRPYTQHKTAQPPIRARATSNTTITLEDGRTLIDGIASWWTAVHGYNHPHIRAAVTAQLQTMPHVMFGGLTHDPAERLARRLAAILPGDLQHVFFSDSGSVSVEVAIKMAIQYWINRGVPDRTRLLRLRRRLPRRHAGHDVGLRSRRRHAQPLPRRSPPSRSSPPSPTSKPRSSATPASSPP